MTPSPDLGEEHLERLLGKRDRFPDRRDLLGVLDLSQGLDPLRRRDQAHPGQGLPDRLELGHAQDARLEAQPPDSHGRHSLDNRLTHRLARGPDAGLQSRAFLLELRRESAVREDELVLPPDEEDRGISGEPGQVGNVRGRTDQQGIQVSDCEILT